MIPVPRVRPSDWAGLQYIIDLIAGRTSLPEQFVASHRTGARTQIPAITATTIQTLTAATTGSYKIEGSAELTAVPGTTTSYWGFYVNGTLDGVEYASSIAQPAWVRERYQRTLNAGDIVTLRVRVDGVNGGATYGDTDLSLTPL